MQRLPQQKGHKTSVLPPLPTLPMMQSDTVNVINNFTPRHNLCLEILIRGCVESFVEFFNLTKEVDRMDSAAEKLVSEKTGTVPLEEQMNQALFENLEFLKEQLCEAEMATRQGRLDDVFVANRNIAQFFEGCNNYVNAIRFHTKCHQTAQQSGNMTHQVEVSLSIGAAYEQYELQQASSLSSLSPEGHDEIDLDGAGAAPSSKAPTQSPTQSRLLHLLEQAMHFYEEHLHRAQVAQSPDGVVMNGRVCLVRIYEAMASMLEALNPPEPLTAAEEARLQAEAGPAGLPSSTAARGALPKIVEYLQKCQQAAHHNRATAPQEGSSWPPLARLCVSGAHAGATGVPFNVHAHLCDAALALHRLGLCYEQLGDLHQSIECQKQYLQMCIASRDEAGAGVACQSLAKAHQALGDYPNAIKYLQTHLTLSSHPAEAKEGPSVPGEGDASPAAVVDVADAAAARVEKDESDMADMDGIHAAQVREACSSLGAILHRQGQYGEAVRCFEHNFDISRTQAQRMAEASEKRRMLVALAATSSTPLVGVLASLRQGAAKADAPALAGTSRNLAASFAAVVPSPHRLPSHSHTPHTAAIIDKARVNLGIAKANRSLAAFMAAVQRGDAPAAGTARALAAAPEEDSGAPAKPGPLGLLASLMKSDEARGPIPRSRVRAKKGGPRLDILPLGAAGPAGTMMDTPVVLRLCDLDPAVQVTLRTSFADDDNRLWRSTARFITDGKGCVNLSTAAPLGEDSTYRGGDPMGIFWSMVPADGHAAAVHTLQLPSPGASRPPTAPDGLADPQQPATQRSQLSTQRSGALTGRRSGSPGPATETSLSDVPEGGEPEGVGVPAEGAEPSPGHPKTLLRALCALQPLRVQVEVEVARAVVAQCTLLRHWVISPALLHQQWVTHLKAIQADQPAGRSEAGSPAPALPPLPGGMIPAAQQPAASAAAAAAAAAALTNVPVPLQAVEQYDLPPAAIGAPIWARVFLPAAPPAPLAVPPCPEDEPEPSGGEETERPRASRAALSSAHNSTRSARNSVTARSGRRSERSDNESDEERPAPRGRSPTTTERGRSARARSGRSSRSQGPRDNPEGAPLVLVLAAGGSGSCRDGGFAWAVHVAGGRPARDPRQPGDVQPQPRAPEAAEAAPEASPRLEPTDPADPVTAPPPTAAAPPAAPGTPLAPNADGVAPYRFALPAKLQMVALEGVHAVLSYLKRTAPYEERINFCGPDRGVAVVGISRGAEAALLLAGMYPQEIRRVVAIVPPCVVFEAPTRTSPAPAEATSPWTRRDEEVPFLPVRFADVYFQSPDPYAIPHSAYYEDTLKQASPDDLDQAAIRVEQINGPLLLISAGADQEWPSKEMAAQLVRRLEKTATRRTRAGASASSGRRHRGPALSWQHHCLERCGHDICPPNMPANTSAPSVQHPEDRAGHAQGEREAWRLVGEFLGLRY
ncbi:putative BAAT / Acyl-CoA thioester hydrolase C terminal [Paratrimastix pyriformis]|uniref:Tetratricopeptide repeat protein 29 n=1 Tax=Paratrimastix pyriformis TaxID=342808 RepID=A0ABQ8UUD7_9EUKA|nr:putative BAAT / Acyl-CoA thioester hydrolase C terminal [Paratrimastix pyriformis]